jgi:hypothetical protein
MSQPKIIVEGTLNPDGTLELHEPPKLSAGRVQVTVKPLATAVQISAGLAVVIQQIQQEQKKRGFVGLSDQDVAAAQNARQEEEDEYEERCKELSGQTQAGPTT